MKEEAAWLPRSRTRNSKGNRLQDEKWEKTNKEGCPGEWWERTGKV